MTIHLTPEDEKLIQEKLNSGAFQTPEEVIHMALASLPPVQPKKKRKNLVDVLSSPPFAGSELDLERIRDYPRHVDL